MTNKYTHTLILVYHAVSLLELYVFTRRIHLTMEDSWEYILTRIKANFDATQATLPKTSKLQLHHMLYEENKTG